jgi:hypothetical protein
MYKYFASLALTAGIVFSSCTESSSSKQEKTEINQMDSASREVKDQVIKLDDQTKKVEESLEKLDKEFQTNNQ